MFLSIVQYIPILYSIYILVTLSPKSPRLSQVKCHRVDRSSRVAVLMHVSLPGLDTTATIARRLRCFKTAEVVFKNLDLER